MKRVLMDTLGIVAAINEKDEHHREAREILRRYREKELSLTDAVSFAVAERLQVDVVIAFDQHFRQYG